MEKKKISIPNSYSTHGRNILAYKGRTRIIYKTFRCFFVHSRDFSKTEFTVGPGIDFVITCLECLSIMCYRRIYLLRSNTDIELYTYNGRSTRRVSYVEREIIAPKSRDSLQLKLVRENTRSRRRYFPSILFLFLFTSTFSREQHSRLVFTVPTFTFLEID